MPPRFTYWTIIFGGQPTSFRSGTREELLPTFKQIQARHPDAQLRYFARGKLWYSEEEAQAALIRDRFEKRQRSGPPRGDWKPRAERAQPDDGSRERRGRDWRPGGEHKDPRDRFNVPRDVKRARFKARQRFDKPPAGGWKPKTGGWKPDAGSWKPKPGSGQPGAGSWKPKPGDRKPEAGRWKAKAGGWKPKPGGGWKPKPGGWKPRRPPFKKKKDEE